MGSSSSPESMTMTSSSLTWSDDRRVTSSPPGSSWSGFNDGSSIWVTSSSTSPSSSILMTSSLLLAAETTPLSTDVEAPSWNVFGTHSIRAETDPDFWALSLNRFFQSTSFYYSFNNFEKSPLAFLKFSLGPSGRPWPDSAVHENFVELFLDLSWIRLKN